MSYHYTASNSTIGGTLGGTLLVLFNLNIHDLGKTAVLAGIGAAVSFSVSFCLNLLTGWVKRRKKSGIKS